MKKLLGIVVLGLLLSGNAYAELSYVCIYSDDKTKERYNFLIENGKLYKDRDFQKTKYIKASSSKAEFRYEFSFFTKKTDNSKKIEIWDTTHKINLKTGDAIEAVRYVKQHFDTSGKLIRTEKEKRWNDILICRIITNSGSSGSGNFLRSILKAIN